MFRIAILRISNLETSQPAKLAAVSTQLLEESTAGLGGEQVGLDGASGPRLLLIDDTYSVTKALGPL